MGDLAARRPRLMRRDQGAGQPDSMPVRTAAALPSAPTAVASAGRPVCAGRCSTAARSSLHCSRPDSRCPALTWSRLCMRWSPFADHSLQLRAMSPLADHSLQLRAMSPLAAHSLQPRAMMDHRRPAWLSSQPPATSSVAMIGLRALTRRQLWLSERVRLC